MDSWLSKMEILFMSLRLIRTLWPRLDTNIFERLCQHWWRQIHHEWKMMHDTHGRCSTLKWKTNQHLENFQLHVKVEGVGPCAKWFQQWTKFINMYSKCSPKYCGKLQGWMNLMVVPPHKRIPNLGRTYNGRKLAHILVQGHYEKGKLFGCGEG